MTDTTPKHTIPPKHAPQATPKADLPNDSYMAQMKGKGGIARIIKAAGYSWDGLVFAYQNELAFRQVVWLNGVAIVLALVLPFGLSIKMILLFGSALSIIAELVNTGLEALVDRISDEYHPLSKVAKDVGSAVQFVALSLLTVLWLMAIWSLFK